MKKDIFIRLAFLASLIILTSLVKHWLALAYWPYWLGGLLGIFLPSVDQIIYVFFLRPYELTSQRIKSLWQQKNYKGVIILLYQTRSERTNLIFHSTLFQIIFAVLTFWVVTSSGSLLGRGLVLSFYLSLLLDGVTWPVVGGILLVIFAFLF